MGARIIGVAYHINASRIDAKTANKSPLKSFRLSGKFVVTPQKTAVALEHFALGGREAFQKSRENSAFQRPGKL